MKLARDQGAQESTSRAPEEPQASPRNPQRVWESPGGPQESPGKPQESQGEPRKVLGDPGEHQESRRRAERSPGELQERPGNMFRIEIIKTNKNYSKVSSPSWRIPRVFLPWFRVRERLQNVRKLFVRKLFVLTGMRALKSTNCEKAFIL